MKSLVNAMSQALPTRFNLQQLTRYHLNIELVTIVDSANHTESVFQLVQWAENHGMLPDLIASALQENPTNPRLQAIANELLNFTNGDSPITVTGQSDWEAKLRQLETQLHAADAQIKVLTSDLNTVQAERDRLIEEKKESENLAKIWIADLKQERDTLRQAQKAAQQRISDLEVAVIDAYLPPENVLTNTGSQELTAYPSELTSEQRRTGYTAILTAFPKWDDLNSLMQKVMGVEAINIEGISNANSLAADLLRQAESQGKLPALLVGMAQANPDSIRLAWWLSQVRAAHVGQSSNP